MEAGIAAFIAKGTPSGWTLCAIGLMALYLLGKIALNQRPQMRQMDLTEGGILREAIAAEMKGLREEITSLRDENNSLRAEVRQLHGIIDGMRREALTGQLSAQRVVADALPKSPEMKRALDKLDNVKGVGQ